MALGFITVASNNGGGAEIISHGSNGFTTNPRATYLAEVLELIHKSKNSKLRSISNKAIDTVEKKYSFQSVAPNYKQLYSTLVRSNHKL